MLVEPRMKNINVSYERGSSELLCCSNTRNVQKIALVVLVGRHTHSRTTWHNIQ